MAKRGPKPTVTDPIKRKLVEYLELGMALAESLTLVGVSRGSFRRARAADEKFDHGIKRAALLGKAHHLRRIHAGESQWQSSAWFLERKYGAEYGKRLEIESNVVMELVEEIVNAPGAGEPHANGQANGTAPPGTGRIPPQ